MLNLFWSAMFSTTFLNGGQKKIPASSTKKDLPNFGRSSLPVESLDMFQTPEMSIFLEHNKR
jgi:hypothetical protein